MSIEYLKIGGAFSFIASALHVAIIFGGASWYRVFGAGEHMAMMAEQGLLQPVMITLFISAVLAVWGAFAWSGAGVFPEFPFLKITLILITSVYLIRGVAGLILPFVSNHPQITQNSTNFWIWSSTICLAIGLIHLKGVWGKWYA